MIDRGYEQSAHLYDLFDTKQNIDFFHHFVGRGEEILDVGAGTGRIAIPLAERGARVFCVEPSAAMHRVFESKLSQRPDLRPLIRLVPGEARSFDLGRRFAGALLSGTFDHFLRPEERIASLANIRRHLSPGGWLVLDVFVGLMSDAPLTPAGCVQRQGMEIRRLISRKVMPDRTLQVLLVFEIEQDGRLVEKIEQVSQAGIVSREEVHAALAEAGYRLEQEYGSYDFRPYAEGDDLLIVHAARRQVGSRGPR